MELPLTLLALVSRHCRGRRHGRKAWKVAEDLRAAGLEVTEAQVLAAAETLRRAGMPVEAIGDPPAIFLDESRRPRDDDRWRPGRRRSRRRRTCPAASWGRGGLR
jgi:hypothetical protein